MASLDRIITIQLQWGLTLSSEETRLRTADSSSWGQLQWGLTLSSEETTLQNLVQGSLNRLQWGLTLSSEETRYMADAKRARRVLQWGLTLSSEETGQAGDGTSATVPASMGPHSFERGNSLPASITDDQNPNPERFAQLRLISIQPTSDFIANTDSKSDFVAQNCERSIPACLITPPLATRFESQKTPP